MEGYADKDDRQPDFERLPGFNRATGTMGLPGHRGVHWASGKTGRAGGQRTGPQEDG
jgi:hypothetical protein